MVSLMAKPLSQPNAEVEEQENKGLNIRINHLHDTVEFSTSLGTQHLIPGLCGLTSSYYLLVDTQSHTTSPWTKHLVS